MNAAEVPDFPGWPSEIPPRVSLSELVDAYHAHGLVLLEHRAGIEPLPDEQVAGHAVAELAVSHALAGRVLAGRWVAVRDALTAGAHLAEAAAAMDLDVDEVSEGLREWADGQRHYGFITRDEHERVLALLRRPGGV